MNEQLRRHNILRLRAMIASEDGTPTGFILESGVIVIESNGGRSENSVATMPQAVALFPTLRILND